MQLEQAGSKFKSLIETPNIKLACLENGLPELGSISEGLAMFRTEY
jgi:hypothetical protein